MTETNQETVDEQEQQAFGITGGKGFQLKFSNGWWVSVQFGYGNYAGGMPGGRFGGLDLPARALTKDPFGRWPADTAEVAVFSPTSSEMIDLGGHDPVVGWVTSDQVAALIAKVASFAPDEGRANATYAAKVVLEVVESEDDD